MAADGSGTLVKSEHHIHGYETVEKALTNPDNYATWVQLAEPSTYSGYKAHVHCETPDDVIWTLRRIWDTIAELGLGAKAGTCAFFERTQPSPNGEAHPQAGKAVVLYFPRRRTWEADMARVCDDLAGSRHDGKGAVGNTPATNGVSWRFELSADPGEDVDRARYLELYSPA